MSRERYEPDPDQPATAVPVTCETGSFEGRTVTDAMITAPKLCGDGATVGELRALFEDDHVHLALLVDRDTLVTVVERADLRPSHPDDAAALTLGSLEGRVVLDTTPLTLARHQMLLAGRRRLAVVDARGRLAGLLCLKRSRTGFCSDAGVLARAEERRADLRDRGQSSGPR